MSVSRPVGVVAEAVEYDIPGVTEKRTEVLQESELLKKGLLLYLGSLQCGIIVSNYLVHDTTKRKHRIK